MKEKSFTNKKMGKAEWNPENTGIAKETIAWRIKTCTSYRGWQHTIGLIDKLGIPFDQLKTAEVGCGTGTFSLTLSLMGASVTLIDYNEKVLENTRKIYNTYGCKATFIKADCLDTPPEEILESFDLVVSGGLAEHFMGKDREKCIAYHKLLLKDRGIAYIGVPNRFSPFYQWIRSFRRLTGTWRILIEIPFSDNELKRLAEKAGFGNSYVLGNASPGRDFVVYSRGFISAVIDILPQSLRNKIRKMKNNERVTAEEPSMLKDIILHRSDKIKSISHENQENRERLSNIIFDKFSAGLILFAFK